jgi:hypothetical protein
MARVGSIELKPAAQKGNRLLGALPDDEFEELRSRFTRVELPLKQVIWEPNKPIDAVYFPIDLVVSILAETEEGPVEVGTVGNEGVVGLPVFLGARSFPGRALVQIPGRADRIDADDFRRTAKQSAGLREVLERYTLGFMTQVSQNTACNRSHTAEQRLARWSFL